MLKHKKDPMETQKSGSNKEMLSYTQKLLAYIFHFQV